MRLWKFRLPRRHTRWPSFGRGLYGYCEFAGWWARDTLWIDGWLTMATPGPLRVLVDVNNDPEILDAHHFCYSRPDLREIPGATGQVLVVPLGQSASVRHLIRALHVQHADKWYRWTPRAGQPIAGDLVARLNDQIPTFFPDIQPDLHAFIQDVIMTQPDLDSNSDELLQRNLSVVNRWSSATNDASFCVSRQQNQRPAGPRPGEPAAAPSVSVLATLPPFMANPSSPIGLCTDRLIQVDSDSLFLSGWYWDAEKVVERLDLTEGRKGFRRDLLDTAEFVHRQDVCDQYRQTFGLHAEGEHGFVAFVDDSPTENVSAMCLEALTRYGQVLRVGMPTSVREPFAAREEVLRTLPDTLPSEWSLFERHLHPALERLQSRCRQQVRIDRQLEFGTPVRSPSSSVLIPLHRTDLMQYQLAQFADDPGMSNCELIYVIDSSAIEQDFEKKAFHLTRLFEIPIRGLVISNHAGYAAAVQLAAAQARGHRLVLMHSDVIPDRPGWLPSLEGFYDAQPRIGVLGPKLLYADQSIQHAGLFFTREELHDGLWTASPYFHGLPRRHSEAGKSRRVAAVSGAMLMIRRDLFEKLGGLRDVYVASDLEDIDLCLRCAENGLETWYLPAAELYHVQEPLRTCGPGWQRNPWSRLYNRWLQTRTWDTTIRTVVAEIKNDSKLDRLAIINQAQRG